MRAGSASFLLLLLHVTTTAPLSANSSAAPRLRLAPEAAPTEQLFARGLAAFEQRDYATAQRHFRTLAARGEPAAETLLGTMAARGQGVARNDAVAAAWFLRASRRGYAPAQLALADSFARGRGVPRDLDRARTLARAAAVQGLPQAEQYARRVTPERYAALLQRP